MGRLIIGVTGAVGSGCSEITKILEQSGEFIPFKISDFLTRKIKRVTPRFESFNDKIKRRKLQDLGDAIRKKGDSGFLVKEAIKQASVISSSKHIVIDSIKNPGEVDEIRKHSNGYVIAVNAPFDIRWLRCHEKYDDDQGLFIEDDERDREGKDRHGVIIPYGQQVQRCVDLADVYIKNDEQRDTPRAKREFREKLMNHLAVLEKPGSRKPTIPELMMNNAYCTSLRSRCLKRQVGAIITIPRYLGEKSPLVHLSDTSIWEEHIISSGYNDVPKGQVSCDKEHTQCYRDKVSKKFYDDFHVKPKSVPGRFLNLCRSIHAEESAILQICLMGGVSLTGATLYSTTFPCSLCAKKIIASGINRIVWLEPYPDKEAKEFLEKAGVECDEFEGIKAQSFFKLFKQPLTKSQTNRG